MKATKRLAILVALIVLVAAGFSLLLTYSDLRYLTDAEKGIPRPEVEDFWRRRVPLASGLGTLAIVVVLGSMRSARRNTLRAEAASLGGVGTIGALVLLSSVSFIVASRQDTSFAAVKVGWVPRAPSFLLVRMLENPSPPATRWSSDGNGRQVPRSPSRTLQQQAIFDELLRRHEAHRLSVADRRVLARNQFEGAMPFTVKTRARWPEGVPVRVTVSGHFAGLMPRELRATPIYPGGLAIVAFHGGVELVRDPNKEQAGWKDRPAYELGQQSIGTPPAGNKVVFDTAVTEAGETIWTGQVAQPIVVEGTIDDILRPVDTPEVRALMTAAIDGSLRLNAECSRVVLSLPSDPLLTGIATGVVVEFVRSESVAATAVFRSRNPRLTAQLWDWQRRDPGQRLGYYHELWASLSGDSEGVCAADPAAPEWFVRVRGNGATALEDYDATAYWSGAVTVPIGRVKGDITP